MRAVGWWLGAVAASMAMAGALTHAANSAAGRTVDPSFWLMEVAAGVGYGGLAMALRGSGATALQHVAAWVALSQGLAVLTTELAFTGWVVMGHEWLVWIGSWAWAPGYAAVVTVIPLLLPDGKAIPGRHWRAGAWLAVTAVVAVATGWAVTPYHQQDFPGAFVDLENPVGIPWGAFLLSPVAVILLLMAAGVACVSVVVRHRNARGATRHQMRSVLVGLLATVTLMSLSPFVPPEVAPGLAAVAMLPLPLAIGVAVLRHGLWGVDLVLSRSLLYVLLGGSAIALYGGLMALFDRLPGQPHEPAALAAGLVSLVVVLTHDLARRRVNVLVHGGEQEPYTALIRLGERLDSLGDPDDDTRRQLTAGIVESLWRVLGADHVKLRLSDGTEENAGAPAGHQRLELPVRYGDEQVGSLTVERAQGFGWSDRRMLVRLAGQAAVALRTALLERAAHEARAQLVRAREEERRRLRHDLHDGIGPSLAALALHAETAREAMQENPAAAGAALDSLAHKLNAVVAEVRALVHDLRPPTLDELGLASAVHELGLRLAPTGVEVKTEADDLGALPAAVEIAAYRIAGEAINNAVRHSGARRVSVRLCREETALLLEVRDEGRGLPSHPRSGVGLSSMRRRAEELGGSLTLTRKSGSNPDQRGAVGTCLVVSLPLEFNDEGRDAEERRAGEHPSAGRR